MRSTTTTGLEPKLPSRSKASDSKGLNFQLLLLSGSNCPHRLISHGGKGWRRAVLLHTLLHTLLLSCTTGLWLEVSKLLPQSWIVMEWVSTLGGHLWQRSSALRPADPGHGLRDLSSKGSSGENFKRGTVLQKRNRNATILSNVSKHSQCPNLPPLLMTLQDQKKTSTCTLHQAHEHLVLAGRVAE